MTTIDSKLAIACAGGPAPGLNSVIGAATIRACSSNVQVLGLQDGFKWIMQGDTSHVVPLTIADTSRIHFRGGSHIGISRANPTKKPEHMRNVLDAFRRLGVGMLVTIGGDDTAYTAYQLAKAAGGALRVAHVPKTIDNDLDLPHDVWTFGYQTARHVGVEIVHNLMVDAKTTGRWYFVVAMGRKAGHLALGIGKAAGATLTLIPEEFGGRTVRLKTIVDTLAGTVLKRLAAGRTDGVVVLAEGLAEVVPPEDLAELATAERDEHGNLRLDEISFGDVCKARVRERLAAFGVKPTIVAKNIGYEVRCADPIPFDMEYTRDLGYCAAKFVIEGGSNALVSIQQGRFKAVPFDQIMNPETGRMRIRMVDINSDRYRIATAYMLRLTRDDFDEQGELAKLAAAANTTPSRFRAEFGHLVEREPARAEAFVAPQA
ncbi:MAG TPA: diphosphate--fructose-6-phosphate 1-phosphotransferase [Polyangiaceae bacterium]|nr:diphosphate--fructose-6-phosphate 1-phosphotransferase [Polyangiaceae bacterium]